MVQVQVIPNFDKFYKKLISIAVFILSILILGTIVCIEANNIFKPIVYLDIVEWNLQIYNRWGEIVFESYDATMGWNGTYGGTRQAPAGTYVWSIEFGDRSSDEKHKHNGHVNLIR